MKVFNFLMLYLDPGPIKIKEVWHSAVYGVTRRAANNSNISTNKNRPLWVFTNKVNQMANNKVGENKVNPKIMDLDGST